LQSTQRPSALHTCSLHSVLTLHVVAAGVAPLPPTAALPPCGPGTLVRLPLSQPAAPSHKLKMV
jgi:hypothetical protein